MPFNLRQIEVFRAVMVAQSISGAAKALHVSQPAVSRLISYTEQRVGLTLFERIKGRLYPTPEARRLFEEVSAVYNSVQRVNQVAEELISQGSGVLRVGCSANLSQSLLPQAVASFARGHPEILVVLETMSPHNLVQHIFGQQVEIGVAYMHVPHPSLATQLLYANHIVAVLPDGHPLAAGTELHVEELANEPFIGYASDIPFGQVVRQCFEGIDRLPKTRVEVQQAHVACALVAAGVGVALVDEQTVRSQQWRGITTRPVVPHIPTPVHVFHAMHQPLSRPAQEFISVLKSHAADSRQSVAI
jgi:DNA-binding transcriptional LysR family regulator